MALHALSFKLWVAGLLVLVANSTCHVCQEMSATDATLSMFGTWPSSSCWCCVNNRSFLCTAFAADHGPFTVTMFASNWCLSNIACAQNLRSNYMQKLWLMSVMMWSCHDNESSTHGEALICIAGVSTRQHDWYCWLCTNVQLLTGWSSILLISATLNCFVVFVNDAPPTTSMLMTCVVSWRPRQQPKKSWGDIGQCTRCFCMFSSFYWVHVPWL